MFKHCLDYTFFVYFENYHEFLNENSENKKITVIAFIKPYSFEKKINIIFKLFTIIYLNMNTEN